MTNRIESSRRRGEGMNGWLPQRDNQREKQTGRLTLRSPAPGRSSRFTLPPSVRPSVCLSLLLDTRASAHLSAAPHHSEQREQVQTQQQQSPLTPSPPPAALHRCPSPSPVSSCSESAVLAPPTPSAHSQPFSVQLQRQQCRDEDGAVCSGRDRSRRPLPPLPPCRRRRCRCPSACCTSSPHSARPA